MLVPLVLDFPSGDAAATARVLAWLGGGAQGELPARVTLPQAEAALGPTVARPFALQATGARPLAAWTIYALILARILAAFLRLIRTDWRRRR